MSKRKSERKKMTTEMESSVSDILVVNERSLRPFIELFTFCPENISQERLGMMLGFFEIAEYSDDSAYIVNFLTSIVKKEYYSNPKRPPMESFESTLHKLNLGLSELAKEGNVKWIGNLDSALCVLDKSGLHFSVTGNGSILLLRDKILSDISEDTYSDESQHPIKTFSNISSGRLKDGDKIIMTSDNIFHIFSLEEIKKSALRFDNEKFVQFLKTALVNELEMAGTIIIDVAESYVPLKPKTIEQKDDILQGAPNAFSEQPFKGKVRKPADPSPMAASGPEKDRVFLSEKKEYTDKKTGHIYIQGECAEKPSESPFPVWLPAIKESLVENALKIKGFLKDGASRSYHKTKEVVRSGAKSAKKSFEEYIKRKNQASENSKAASLASEVLSPSQFSLEDEMNKRTNSKNEKSGGFPKTRKSEPRSIGELIRLLRESGDALAVKARGIRKKISDKRPAIGDFRKLRAAERMIPKPSKIKSLFADLPPSQRLAAVAILASIIMVPLFVNRLFDSPKDAPASDPFLENTELDVDPNPADPDGTSLNQIYETGETISSVFLLGGKMLAVTEKSVTQSDLADLESEGTFPFPEGFRGASFATTMDDLSLLFLIDDENTVISYSPVSRRFQENSIDIPAQSKIAGVGTYLTYLYILDASNKKIYRYPRAEGGFGERLDWLGEDADISEATDMAIDDNIYISSKDEVLKFFRGKKEDFSISKAQPPVKIEKIHTLPSLGNIYAIDRDNGQLVQLSKSGEIKWRHQDDRIKSTTGLFADETNGLLYMADLNRVYSLEIPD